MMLHRMKSPLTVVICLMTMFSLAQTKERYKPLDPYPIEGQLIEHIADSSQSKNDTIFISGCPIQLMVDGEIMVTTQTDHKGNYKLTFPLIWFEKKTLKLRTSCEGYSNLDSGPLILYSTSYPASGMVHDFELIREK